MPSNQNPLGALPRRFRQQRLLVVGCGDVGLRVAAQLPAHIRKLALTSSPERTPQLQALGIQPLLGNLDHAPSLHRLAGIADRVLHLAPPPTENKDEWWRDPRTANLLQALRRRSLPTHFIYGSTTGVYGDCQGDWVSESRTAQAHTSRAHRRVDAEQQILNAARGRMTASILRIPGIYANDREGGTPRTRLLRGTPVLEPQDDVYTNHIHADDLACACIAALWRSKPQRVYNITDDTQLKMGDYFDLAADLYALPRAPRISRETAQGQLPLMLLSFMSESRRLTNERMKRELRVRLSYPQVLDGLKA
ncbi:MAG: SDR family oxidoreductase [Burkholderiales bacterium]|nr:MAG: SDR family oxidoreductase [Burkholderiales bacterium]